MMLTVSSGMPTNSGASNSPASKEEKKLQEEELLYNPLLTQQQELLQLHQVRSLFVYVFFFCGGFVGSQFVQVCRDEFNLNVLIVSCFTA